MPRPPELTPRQYRVISRVALWLLCAIVVTGASVRLTGSGLGCSDWPGCEQRQFFAAWEFKPMVEFVNRMITGLVSLAVIAAAAGSLLRRPRRPDLTRWSLLLIAGVVAQIIIGAFVTLSELKYSIVAVHFWVSMVLVMAAVVLCDLAASPDETLPRRRRAWSRDGRVVVGLTTLVLVTGPAATNAGPHAGSEDIKRLPVDLKLAVQVHSLTVWILCVAVLLIARNRREQITPLLVAIVAQGAIGYFQYFAGVPPLAVGVHVAMATLLWVMAIRFGLGSRDAAKVQDRELIDA